MEVHIDFIPHAIAKSGKLPIYTPSRVAMFYLWVRVHGYSRARVLVG